MNKLKEVKDIIVHHSKSIGGSLSFLKHIHVIDNGWSDVGYHWIICNGKSMRDKYGRVTWVGKPDGKVQVGRKLKYVPAQVKNHNRNSVGICLIGDFGTQTPTDKQINSLVSLLTTMCIIYNLQPGVILGHRDVGNSTCPGDKMYQLLPEIRERVRLEINRMNSVKRLKVKLGWMGKFK
jgi:hypothetical protein